MKLFGFQIGKKDDDDFDLPRESPPDFSQPMTESRHDDPYAQKDFSYDSQSSDPYAQDTFSHQIFTSDTPTPGDRARNYANSLSSQSSYPSQSQTTPQSSSSYGGAVSGHEAQLILEKLDTIKAEIDSVKQRMMRIERYMDSAEQKAGQKRMW